MAGVALRDIYLRCTLQAWHLETSTFVSRGRRGTCCTWWRAWSPLVAVARPASRASLRGRRGTWRHLLVFHVAAVALGDIYLRFTWQAWHLETSTFVSRGRRGTWRHLLAFGVAGVALVALGGALGRRWSPLVARGAAPVCVAGVGLGDIYFRFTRQAWHCVSRGRPGTWRHLLSFHVAGVLLGDIYFRFTWQAWHLETSTFVSRGRRGTWRHLLAFGVAGVALVALGGALGRRWSPLVARGAAPVCVAGVGLGDIYFRFTRQAWHCVSRGRPGTWRHLLSFHVAGVLLGDIYFRFTWQAWHLETSTCVWHLPSFHVAGVVLGDIYLRLAWQVWHLLHLLHLIAVGLRWSPLVARGAAPLCVATWHKVTSTFISRGRRGTCCTCCTWWRAWSPLVAVGRRWSPGAPHQFAWQAWHLETSTFVSRGRRGTWRHLPAFHVASVALGDIHLSHAIFDTPSLTQLCHTPLCHTPSLTHHFVTHHLSHTIFDTPSFTHHLCHTLSSTHHLSPHHLSHSTLSHTLFDTPSFTHHFVTHHL